MNKKGRTGPGFTALWVIVGIVAAVVLIMAFGGIGQKQTSTGEITQITACDSTTTPSVTLKAYDGENPGTALTEATNAYRIKGEKTWTNFTAGTAFAADVGQMLEIVMGASTTDYIDNAHGQTFEYTVPCVETPSQEYEMFSDEDESGLTATFYDSDDNAAGEVFVAGQTQTVSIKLKSATDQIFGNPYLPSDSPNVLCLQLNNSAWDQPEQVYTKDGTEFSSTEVPTRLDATASKTSYCYGIPVITDKEIRVYMDLNADDTNAPAVDDTAYVFSSDWFINQDTSELDWGVETEDDVNVSIDSAKTITLDFT